MLVACIYGEYKQSKCYGCALSGDCDVKKIASHKIQEKTPDATTEDFVMCRGEFDVYNAEYKVTVPKEALQYNLKVVLMRKRLGLE